MYPSTFQHQVREDSCTVKALCCSSSERGRPGSMASSFESCAYICVLVMPSLIAGTKLPPFPMLYFHMAEYKIGSKRSVAKGFFLYMLSLFREEIFPKNSQHISPYILIVGTGSHVSYCQRGIALS